LARLAGTRHHLRRDLRSVALTFDDGPDPDFTPLVLDALAAAEIRATFFFVGRHASAHPELVTRARAEGHRIGTHSQNHTNADGARPRALIDDYRSGRACVEKILGSPVKLFRPPQGRISPAAVWALRWLSLDVWLWTLDPEDWRSETTANAILQRMKGIVPGDVVLLHDGTAHPGPEVASDRSATVAALERIGDLVRGRGLTFATL
jgi:peptidoglycan/xylan/chitin deacetylase (PgdA/CDA1 family)